jgi:hypothetical protein
VLFIFDSIFISFIEYELFDLLFSQCSWLLLI